jgi:transcriptional regulator with XRE-family HTH domain
MTTAKATAPKKSTGKAKAANPRARKAADTLPNRVRLHREANELSPKDLAAKIGGNWTASTVRRIERGAKHATPEQQAQLAEALQVSADSLFPDALPSIPVEPRAKKPARKRTPKTTAEFTEAVQEILA